MNASDPIISHRMQCRMDAEPAALERLCQVVRIRGFTIEKMQVQMGRGVLDIELTVKGERAVQMLASQLEKLQTVTGLTLGEERSTGQLQHSA
ncbi:MAG: acetolactate synthase [Alteromonadaceae bacterium]|uniref:ACT domain-containing protein n=1 Tax=unclassified Marinobacter TaxID=83889 RepID=UPI000C5E43C6|nr:ACT domain-containing protein [Marinobacter sp. BGYM27]MAA66981.1 acetolactate synthase [Alteromonadaceae bacterium]MBH83956.1 acetolactate synthase [Alteromonadaceae bacterium]MDG5499457.1 ACT domain-containing protein [Marinobacter sp. BGYM27]